MKLRSLIKENINEKKLTNEGAILKAIRPSLTGDVKKAVAELEEKLVAAGVDLDKHADELAYCVIDIINEAKQEGY